MSDEGHAPEPDEVTIKAGSDGTSTDRSRPTADVAAVDGDAESPREFGFRGWILVGWLVVALVVVPAYLYVYPRASETLSLFGLGYRDTFLFVPLLPALVLGVLAVWAATRG